jgi:hypothetical protein
LQLAVGKELEGYGDVEMEELERIILYLIPH